MIARSILQLRLSAQATVVDLLKALDERSMEKQCGAS